ncbi:glycerate kinase [Pseudarthrobacter cellobiosi]|uniref:glycerate kinase n=1 Tax=Pseudarthrobacter cellobiosi TaxID=2953654 RepID=UPI00208FA2D9|nr:glycerate kinase [Pseudarthrobacter sp. HLT1-5]MCO4274605.1 glycerate kinase [Pseudarthrobacter sp. HLT3-5]
MTGEGCYDGQSAAGKVPTELAGLADAAGIRTALVAGSIRAGTEHFTTAVSLAETAGSVEAAISSPGHWLEEAAAILALRISEQTEPPLPAPGSAKVS